jgi:hypothetical protein
MEVDSRLSTDKETKTLIQNLIKNVMVEVASVKDLSDKTVQKLIKDVKDTAHDSAERAHFLSRYIDEEVVKVAKQVENIKTLCAKLTEQFKKHLINHENMKKDIYKRFEIIESHLPIYRSELYKLLEGTETRCLSKMKEVKDAIE